VLCEQCHHSTQSFGTTTVRYSQTDLRKATSGYGVVKETWMDDVSCVECHMFTTGRGVTPAKQSHDWTPDPEACMVCHSEWETADEVEAYIEGVQARTEALVTEANAYVADIKALKTWAEANESVPGELWTASLNETYYEALWDITLVTSDGSMGMHNPDYSRQMLEAGIMMAGEIKDALNVGGVSGKIEYSTTPATPIANATIKDGYGNQVAKTGADGSYFFWAPAMNRLYVIELDGKAIGTLSASGQAQQNKTVGTTTIEKAAQSSTNGGGEEDNEEGMLNTLSYGLIAVIVILIVLLVVMAMRKK
jgi:hypothetical protein